MKINTSPAILEIIGYSGTGKTTLIEKLIPALRKRGIRLAVIKHTSHHHELDQPGKDSHRLRLAGAEAVVVSSPKMVAMFREIEKEWPVARLLRHLPRKIDLVIAEGFRHSEYPCLEVFRRGLSPDLKCRDYGKLLAVVGDDPGDLDVPHFHRGAVRAITEFLLRALSLQSSNESRLARGKKIDVMHDIGVNAKKSIPHKLMEKMYESHRGLARRTWRFLRAVRIFGEKHSARPGCDARQKSRCHVNGGVGDACAFRGRAALHRARSAYRSAIRPARGDARGA
jgi:molybdopterin-guanine dinucleotide biosynthesis protein MobB